jgi:hypothetical protein
MVTGYCYANCCNAQYAIFSTNSSLLVYRLGSGTTYTNVTSTTGITIATRNYEGMSISTNNIFVHNNQAGSNVRIYSLNTSTNVATLRNSVSVTNFMPVISRDGTVILFRDISANGSNRVYSLDSSTWAVSLVQTFTKPANTTSWGYNSDLSVDGTHLCFTDASSGTKQEYYKRSLTGTLYSYNYHHVGHTTDGVVLQNKIRCASTDSLQIPSGTTAQRPSNNELISAGGVFIRYNTDTSGLEIFIGGVWRTIAYT